MTGVRRGTQEIQQQVSFAAVPVPRRNNELNLLLHETAIAVAERFCVEAYKKWCHVIFEHARGKELERRLLANYSRAETCERLANIAAGEHMWAISRLMLELKCDSSRRNTVRRLTDFAYDQMKIETTPAFMIDGKVEREIDGSWNYDKWVEFIKQRLSEKQK